MDAQQLTKATVNTVIIFFLIKCYVVISIVCFNCINLRQSRYKMSRYYVRTIIHSLNNVNFLNN